MTCVARALCQAADQGFFAEAEPLLGTLLGREPKTRRDVLARPAAHW